MVKKEYRVLGHKVEYNVTSSSEEFNKLDPKRPDAANDEAVANIVYRIMNPDTRHWFLHGLTEEEDMKKLAEAGINASPWIGVEADSGIDRYTEPVKGKDGKVRMKDGVEVVKVVESEEKYYDRVLATLVEQKKFASEDAAREHYQSEIARIASYVPFDITAPARVDRAPKKLAAKFKLTAAKILATGNVDHCNANQFVNINKTFTATGDMEKPFTGKYTDKSGKEVDFTVSDKDAEVLGWLVKEYSDWKASQVLAGEF